MKLTSKLITLVTITVIFILVLYISMVNSRLDEHLSQSQIDWVDTLATSISESIAQDTINQEKLRVRNLLKKVVENEEAIEFAYVTDMQSKLFAHTFDGGFPRFLIEKDIANPKSRNKNYIEYKTVQGQIIEYHTPLIEGLEGEVHLGLNHKEINSILARINKDLLLSMSLVGLFVVFVTVLIGNRISKPLVQFTEQLKRLDHSNIQYPNLDKLDPDTRELIRTFKDLITERENNRYELEKHRDHLEDLVNERTLELQTAINELEAFSYSVSHDLRAPLRGIDGFSLALLEDYEDKLDDDGKDYLRRVRAGTQKMGTLIDDLLILSRASRDTLKQTTVDLSELANNAKSQLQENHPGRQIQVDIKSDMKTLGDASLLSSVIDNLLGNAWKYTSKNPHARIEFSCFSQDNTTVFFVKDNGVGFDMSYKDKLFGAFQRLHKDIDFPGTGIGLAIVQRIINRHGGKVWAESDLNKGATFYFSLPNQG